MSIRHWLVGFVVVGLLACCMASEAGACAGVAPEGKHVVNADQTVILIWDPVTKREHFIRKATFKSDAKDFGFLIPTPSQPEVAESGEGAFPFLAKLTEPVVEYVKRSSGGGCGCGGDKKSTTLSTGPAVRVVEEKDVAGYRVAVLETKSATGLVDWLKEHGYPYSPAVEAWARPYVESGWMVTAFRVAPEGEGKEPRKVSASALRLSFQTDRPLFPYREPESKAAADFLWARERLLRIFLVTDARYQGELTQEQPWTGKTAWSGKLSAEQRGQLVKHLGLPETAGPKECWLTEFEDPWPYRTAPADLYFARSADQAEVRRPAITEYVAVAGPADVVLLALCGVAVVARARRRRA